MQTYILHFPPHSSAEKTVTVGFRQNNFLFFKHITVRAFSLDIQQLVFSTLNSWQILDGRQTFISGILLQDLKSKPHAKYFTFISEDLAKTKFHKSQLIIMNINFQKLVQYFVLQSLQEPSEDGNFHTFPDNKLLLNSDHL